MDKTDIDVDALIGYKDKLIELNVRHQVNIYNLLIIIISYLSKKEFTEEQKDRQHSIVRGILQDYGIKNYDQLLKLLADYTKIDDYNIAVHLNNFPLGGIH